MKSFYSALILIHTLAIGSVYFHETTESSKKFDDRTYHHLITYGQSLATGAQSYPALSTENIAGNYMIGDQVWINFGNTNSTEFIPLKASIARIYQNYPKSKSSMTSAEDPLIGLTNHLQLKQSQFGVQYVASSDGVNGKSIEALSKPGLFKTNYYKEYFLKSVESAASIARNNGYKIKAPAIFLMHGEFNYINLHDDRTRGATLDKNEYKRLFVNLKNDMQKDIMNAYGQRKKPVLITYQVGSSRSDDNVNIGLAQLELSNTYEDIISAGPTYHLPHRGIHLDANGYRWYGEIMAKVYYKTQVLGEEFKPLQPKQIYRISSKSVGVVFHVPHPPLVFDTNLVKALPNYGFKLKNNGALENISEVKIDQNENTVIITCANDITGNVEVIYGQQNIYHNGKFIVKAGNLRDSDDYQAFFTYVDLDTKKDGNYIYPRERNEMTLRPDIEPRDKDGDFLYGKPYPLYNFSVAFGYTLEANRSSIYMPGFYPNRDIVYVKKGGKGDGSSWDKAYGELADVLKIAGEQNIGEIATIKKIWVSKGTYSPLYIPGNGTNQINDRSFLLPKNVEIYGGFSGMETSLLQRDWKNNASTLFGDNVYHVVISSGDVGNATLDGFTIKGGKANLRSNAYKKKSHQIPYHIEVNNSWVYTGYGAGIYIINSSPKLKNLIITENEAVDAGAGLLLEGSNSSISNIIIKDNILSDDRAIGGCGIYSYKSSPILQDVSIINNKIETINTNALGAGIYNKESDHPTLTNVIISENSIINSRYKNVIGKGGGIFNKDSRLLLINSLITKNKAGEGGGIYIEGSDGSEFTNITISDNEVSNNKGSGLYCNYAKPVVNNSIIWGNKPNTINNNNQGYPSFNYSLVQYNEDTNNHNIMGKTDPLFEDDYTLNVNSPVINKGNNDYVRSINKDLNNYPRIVKDIIDIGAYEYQNEASCARLKHIVINDLETTYDGNPKDISINDLPDYLTHETRYKGIENTSFDENIYPPTEVGKYLVTAILKDNSISKDCEIILTATLTIKKGITKIISDEVVMYSYDGTEKKINAALNHNNSTISYIPQQGYVNAGRYIIKVKSAETPNYLPEEKDIILVIEKANYSGISLPNKTINYDGSEKEIVVDGIIPKATEIVYEYEGINSTLYPKQKNKPVNAGTYLVTATLTNPNYNTLSLRSNLTISKADFMGIKLNEKITTYNSKKQGISVFITDKLPNETKIKYEYEGVSPTIYAKSSEEPINSGIYRVTASIINNNYNTLTLSNNLFIKKAEAFIYTNEEQIYTYDGTIKNVEATLNHKESILKFSPQKGYATGGSYNIIISAEESPNYLSAFKAVKLIIKNLSLGANASEAVSEEIRIASNPVSNILELIFSKPTIKKENLTIYNFMGKLVVETKVLPGDTVKKIDLSGHHSGIYILKYKNKMFRFIKE